MSSIFFML